MSGRLASDRLGAAAALAAHLHAGQTRKGSTVPYVSHCFAVSAMVMEAGGTEDQAIAALLHDGPEDSGGEATLARIEAEFGHQVAELVEACSEPLIRPKPPWRQRKETFLAKIAIVPEAALLIITADKIHNMESLAEDLNHWQGEDDPFERFSGHREGTLWYYQSLTEGLLARTPNGLTARLTAAWTRLQERA
ncbi:MAG: HD domain-containing protein [Magnetovibrionaceae bacterium]